MNKKVFAHVPYPHLGRNLDYLIANRINPEIFFSADSLDEVIPERMQAEAAALAGNGLVCTIHAPFMDLNPGSVVRQIREVTRCSFNDVLDSAEIFKPQIMVFHPGYDRWRYGEKKEEWLRHSIDTWQGVLERAEGIGCTIAVENIFEEEPSTLVALLEAINSPRLRHCFDVGHWNLFKTVGMEEWFAALGSYIAETHIHDNHGFRDDHAPLGEGGIDFKLFFSLMERYAPEAALTIEAHSLEKLERALTNLQQFLP
ncbi:TIM barrel protein, AP endonuclease family 2/xylose isomerase-like family [Geotalea daltonii FRC-32]|uniref:TIM barrel protein, AP endonuclease family 2/xylose isomerase-like family n=1 Tax=Geotalea daltonii (strain DSM 22248 / JCM 15807 / FRC-32) TaxID=316067 RepID=B9LZW7_GEODF|nr:sugar phosphate isomerase/epimerase family protein [Geotalea daltonii]ACM18931.1 TIM barrel protein, AP endonuclease family 2/xylose isomerase-like family [Geotalea daltonii FRC-32]